MSDNTEFNPRKNVIFLLLFIYLPVIKNNKKGHLHGRQKHGKTIEIQGSVAVKRIKGSKPKGQPT